MATNMGIVMPLKPSKLTLDEQRVRRHLNACPKGSEILKKQIQHRD